MTPWTKVWSLVAVALCTSAMITTSNARAEQVDDVDETAVSAEAIVSDANDVDVEHNDYDRDRDRDHRGYGHCYSYCDNERDSCVRRYYRGGHDDWREGRRHRWDEHHGGNAGYRVCERRFDYCIDSCRDNRWGHR